MGGAAGRPLVENALDENMEQKSKESSAPRMEGTSPQLKPDVDAFFQEMLSKRASTGVTNMPIDTGTAAPTATRKRDFDFPVEENNAKSYKAHETKSTPIRHDISDDSSDEADHKDNSECGSPLSPLPYILKTEPPSQMKVMTPPPNIVTTTPTQSRPNIALNTPSSGGSKDGGDVNAFFRSNRDSPDGTGLMIAGRGPPPPRSPHPLPPNMAHPYRNSPEDARKMGSPPAVAGKMMMLTTGAPRSSPSPTHASTNLRPTTTGGTTPTHRTGGRPILGGNLKPNPSGVIETNDVKRNTAQLPATFNHAKPTGGDYLKQRYIVNNYILLDVLGTGSYASVRLCKDRTTDTLFAIKIISRDMLKKKKNGHTSETFLADIQREIAIMKKLNHPNVLRLFEVLDDPNVNKLYLVLEFCKKGDLINFLQSRENGSTVLNGKETFAPLSDRQLWNIFRQVVSGVIYLHYQNIVHGDIKPQNILVGEDGVVKIADFGISKMLDASGEKVVDAAGTPAFMSPELCGGEAYDGQLADVWAIGATMFMLKFGAPPFIASNIMSLYYKIQNDPLVFPFVINPNLQDLLEKMLVKAPSDRFTLPQVSSHIWLLQPPLYNSSEQIAMNSKEDEAGQKKAMFHPPVSYSKAHEAAMAHRADVTSKDIFLSIGVGGVNAPVSADGNEGAMSGTTEEDMMKTGWGEDVFDKIDDEEYAEDSDDGEEGSPKVRRSSNAPVKSIQSKGSSDDAYERRQSMRKSSISSMASQHDEMTEEEEANRGKKFRGKLARKSFVKADGDEDAVTALPVSTKVTKSPLPRKVSSKKMSQAEDGSDDEAEEITMHDFNEMLDTLGMQPKISRTSSVEIGEYTINMDLVAADIRNTFNGVSAAYHSEQGSRPSQEDRCVVYHNAKELAAKEEFGRKILPDEFNSVTIVCIFDGHSGFLTAQILVEKFFKALVANEAFQKKQWKDALTETFRKIDAEICATLGAEDDSSGSTGVVVIIDGKKNILTVANVGDSRCILSRGGRAVKLHRLHRLSESDERERIIAAGGTVLKNRVNGVLAISRAFGDIEFKGSNPLHGLVIAVPDIHVERITPMTELLILGTDGLFDVMETQAVVNLVREMLHKKTSLQDAARQLTKEALDRGSVDNVTVVILSLNTKK